eukprot:4672147-Karenia_brevis.AAC.1
MSKVNEMQLPLFVTQHQVSNKVQKKLCRDIYHILEDLLKKYGISVEEGLQSVLPKLGKPEFEHKLIWKTASFVMVQGTLQPI